MKRKMRISTFLVVLLLIAGVGVILYPKASDLYSNLKFKHEITLYQETADEKDYSDLWAAADEYNQYLKTKPDQLLIDEEEIAWANTLLNPRGNNMIGYIRIPKINVELPIYHGTDEKQLQSGAGWWIGTSLPTGGEGTHCILTAHTGLVKAKFFTDVDQLEIGDHFKLNILNRNLEYEIDQILVVLPEELSELYVKEGKDYVTLYTCTPYGINSHRLLVRGTRVEYVEEEENDTGLTLWQIILISVAGVMIILAFIIISKRFFKKSKKEVTAKHMKR